MKVSRKCGQCKRRAFRTVREDKELNSALGDLVLLHEREEQGEKVTAEEWEAQVKKSKQIYYKLNSGG